MERKSKAAAETGIYLVIVAAILVVANVISFARLQALRHDQERALHPLQGLGAPRPRRPAARTSTIDALRDARPAQARRVHPGPHRPDERVRARRRRQVPVHDHRAEDRRASAGQAKEAGLQEAAFGEGSETGEDQALDQQGLHGHLLQVRQREGGDPDPVARAGRRASSSGSPTRSARSATAPTTSSRRSASSPARTRSSSRDANLVAAPGGRGRRPEHEGDPRAGVPLLQARGRRPPERRGRDQQGARRPHHHAARQGLHREGAAPHRPVPDAREQVASSSSPAPSTSRRATPR